MITIRKTYSLKRELFNDGYTDYCLNGEQVLCEHWVKPHFSSKKRIPTEISVTVSNAPFKDSKKMGLSFGRNNIFYSEDGRLWKDMFPEARRLISKAFCESLPDHIYFKIEEKVVDTETKIAKIKS